MEEGELGLRGFEANRVKAMEMAEERALGGAGVEGGEAEILEEIGIMIRLGEG